MKPNSARINKRLSGIERRSQVHLVPRFSELRAQIFGDGDGSTLHVRRLSGFTLVEVLIVVVLLAIIASVLVPAMGDPATSQLRGASLILSRDIQYVQAEAMNTGRTLQVDFTTLTRYQVSDPTGGVGGAPLLLRHPQSDYPQHNNQFIVDFGDPGPVRGTTIASANFGGRPRLEFGKYGEPTVGGEVILHSSGNQVRIIIASITGLVSVGDLEKAR